MNNPNSQENINDTGPTVGEVEGPGGMAMPGGEVTDVQDADAALQQSVGERTGLSEMEQAQQAGSVAQQTVHSNPHADHPKSGLPVENLESESSGKASENDNVNNENANENENDAVKKKPDSADTSETGESELSAAKAQVLQVAADFENFRKQAARRENETRERAVRSVVEDLLPVLDNFQRAVGAATSTQDVTALKTGIDFILQQFEEALKSHGVEPIEAVGKIFDPKTHEALEQIESDQKSGTIVDDVQRGYSFKGQVLRPSRVRVAK